jgi:hypothetical protein
MRGPSIRPSWISKAEIVARSDAAQYCPSIYIHGIFNSGCRQDGPIGRFRALKRKRTLGDGHCGDDTGRRGASGQLRGFVEGSTNRAPMERGRVCEGVRNASNQRVALLLN